MKSREQLRNDYEEALFELIMDEVVEFEGELLRRENSRLRREGLDIPDEVDARCRETINCAFENIKKQQEIRRTKTVWKTILIAALVSCLLFTTVYATVPAVRTATLNFVVEITQNVAIFKFFGDEQTSEGVSSVSPQYRMNYIPFGFEFSDSGADEYSMWESYISENGRIDFSAVCGDASMLYGVDLEDCVYEELTINGCSGLFTEKNERFHVVLYDDSSGVIIDIVCNGLSKNDVLMIAQGVEKIK